MTANRPLSDLERMAFARGALTRRELLRRAGVAGGVVAGASLLAACGSSGSSDDTTTPAASGPATIDKTVSPNWTFSNWPFYIDVKGKNHPSLDLFDKEFSTKTKYLEDIDDNETFFGKVKAQLEAGQSIDRDIVVLTDWMAGKWVALGYAEKLDKSVLPNVVKSQTSALRGRSIDPNDEYLVPWQSGFTGIAYNPKLTGRELTAISDLWDPAFHGKVTLLTEMRDTLGLVMQDIGIDPSACTIDDAQAAVDAIQPHVDSQQVRRFTGNDYAQDLAKGNVVACMGWSGDVVQLQFDNPDLKFVIPDKGGIIWTDNLLIPKGSENAYNAHLWMDFCYRPEIAAMIEAYVNYICPVDGAKEALITNDPDTANNPLIFPPQETLDNVKTFKALTPEEEAGFNELFLGLTGE
ncbi:MAG: spermidine/putrescine transport system substrate-binding protein [Gaiellales bacterium]|jgi:spermidine/putrescine transport system substrate-binding protein|nr:spermidine/putrescine transport system substrate-binding protein [Gaiellales bacterium]